MITNCLTYEQLQAYSTLPHTDEHMQLYKHISNCELCACAVNGFTAIPFASKDLVAIHREIDAKINATAGNSLAFTRALIVAASLLSVLGVNLLCETHMGKHSNYIARNIESNSKSISGHEAQKKSKEQIHPIAETVKKVVTLSRAKTIERNLNAIERLDLIKPNGIVGSVPVPTKSDIITSRPEKNIIYLYDLKISDYYNLYFGSVASNSDLFKTHTPVFMENPKSIVTELEAEENVVTADRILKQGLQYYNKQKFNAALLNFNILLDLNQDDVNAQFYSALTYYNLSQSEKALQTLDKVMKNPNTSFYPEAEWLSALINLKTGKTEEARSLFSKIIQEKGFYSKRASEKYKGL